MALPDKHTVMDLVHEFYKDFDVLAALPAVIAAMIISFDKIPDQQKTIFSDLAIGLFGSTIILSVIALTLNKIVLFKFQGHGRLTDGELWIPTGLVDISRYPIWVTALFASEALILSLGAMVLSSKIWADMSKVQETTLRENSAI